MSVAGIVVRGVLDLLGWRRRVCALIEWPRPGAGHAWLERTDPPMRVHCGTSRIEWRLR